MLAAKDVGSRFQMNDEVVTAVNSRKGKVFIALRRFLEKRSSQLPKLFPSRGHHGAGVAGVSSASSEEPEPGQRFAKFSRTMEDGRVSR